MTRTFPKRLLFWAPRVLCILFAFFVALFALDVFSEHSGFWKTILALLIHLLPSGIILGILAISWRWEWAAGVLFLGLAAWYISTARAHWDWCLVIGGPLILVGALFLIDWRVRTHALHPQP
ncbi:MAG TPA: hypothetical protein VKM93_26030 [Terriglobia bacterium]|nr:hypothetical protein [Terriglobia bacterium]